MAFNALSKSLAVLLLAMSPLLIHCEKQASEQTAEPGAQQPTAEARPSVDEAGGEPAEAQAPSADIYPGFNLGQLSADKRLSFKEVAEAELCPCPGSTQSLHACLQDTRARCGLAMQAAVTVAESVNRGLNKSDTLNRVAEVVAEAKKSYEFQLEGQPFKGSAQAKVIFVEFADFTCPHCKTAAGVMDEVVEKYGDDVALYFKNFPLGSPDGQMAARAAMAAERQGKFWEMHDRLFKYQSSLTAEKIDRFARQLGLNKAKFKADMSSDAIMAAVQGSKQEGVQAGVTATPTLFINGKRYMGMKTVEAISAEVEQALKTAEEAPDGE